MLHSSCDHDRVPLPLRMSDRRSHKAVASDSALGKCRKPSYEVAWALRGTMSGRTFGTVRAKGVAPSEFYSSLISANHCCLLQHATYGASKTSISNFRWIIHYWMF